MFLEFVNSFRRSRPPQYRVVLVLFGDLKSAFSPLPQTAVSFDARPPKSYVVIALLAGEDQEPVDLAVHEEVIGSRIG